MVIRTEDRGDRWSASEVHRRAFARDVEALLVDRLYGGSSFIPELSLIAEVGGQVVGQALFTRASIEERPAEDGMLVLGPIGVLPEYQRQGIGSALIREGLRRAEELGFRGVALIGHPTYYPQFGFRPASQFGLRTTYQVPDEVFMAVPLREGSLEDSGGLLLFPPEFADA